MAAYEQGAIDLETVKAVQLAIIAHCELMGDRMAILDPPPAMCVQDVATWRTNEAGYDSKFAALYYPWIKVLDPLTGSNRYHSAVGAHRRRLGAQRQRARCAQGARERDHPRRGRRRRRSSPAIEQETLNPIGVNAIRGFPGRGIRVWGARTLSSDPAWRYINVRRLFNYLEKSILNGDAVRGVRAERPGAVGQAQPLDLRLPDERVARAARSSAARPDEAFYVKCDDETNPADRRSTPGQVVCQIGVAPVKPAEFVIFELSQFSGGTSLVTE